MDEGWRRIALHAADFQAPLDDAAVGRLRAYTELLSEWSPRFNLTSIREPRDVLYRHVLDSLSSALIVDYSEKESLIDVGSGAGFPGLVLKIAFPHLQVVLLDSVEKKLRFVQRVIDEVGLADVRVLHERAEAAGHDPLLREQFDAAVARAVAPLSVLVEWLLPFARPGGQAVGMKGPDPGDEVKAALPAIARLGGGAPRVRELELPDIAVGRSLILIPKVTATPADLPRRQGAARKRPLAPVF